MTLLHRKTGISNVVIVIIAVIIVALLAGSAYYFVSSTSSTSSSTKSSGSPLILYSADAYVAEASALESAFSTSTGIQMAPPKGGGSFLLAREIAQGNPVSVFLSVAKSAVSESYLNSTFGGWAIAFATDQMAIAYSNATLRNGAAMSVLDSYHAAVSANTTGAWFDFFSNLTSGSVKVGISDPNSDPAGLRGWIVLEAAGYTYDNNTGYFANRMLSNHGNITSSSAAELVSPLQAGQIQFLFIYKSAAVAQNLGIVQLSAKVSLGSPAFGSYYSQFSYNTSSGVQNGGTIELFLTVPKDSTNPSDSLQFVSFVVKNAPTILSNYGLLAMSPAKLFNDTSVPAPIQQLISEGDLALGGSL